MISSHRFKIVAIAAIAAVAACGESPIKPPVPCTGLIMDLPPARRPWDTSDVALVAAIAAESGHAVIAFKEPSSAHVLATGCRAAVSDATVMAGLNLLRANDVEVIDMWGVMAAAHVRMRASVAPGLRRHPLVDYLEPRQWGSTNAMRRGSSVP